MGGEEISGISDKVVAEVIDRIGRQPGVTYSQNFADLDLKIPSRDDLTKAADRLPDDKKTEFNFCVGVLLDFLDSPIIDFEGANSDQEIMEVENEIINLYPTSSKKSRLAVEAVLDANRLRANKVSGAHKIILLLTTYIDNPDIKRIAELLPDVTSSRPEKVDEYSHLSRRDFSKEMARLAQEEDREEMDLGYAGFSEEKKLQVVRQLSKAAEMTLRVLVGDRLTEEDFQIFDK